MSRETPPPVVASLRFSEVSTSPKAALLTRGSPIIDRMRAFWPARRWLGAGRGAERRARHVEHRSGRRRRVQSEPGWRRRQCIRGRVARLLGHVRRWIERRIAGIIPKDRMPVAASRPTGRTTIFVDSLYD